MPRQQAAICQAGTPIHATITIFYLINTKNVVNLDIIDSIIDPIFPLDVLYYKYNKIKYIYIDISTQKKRFHSNKIYIIGKNKTKNTSLYNSVIIIINPLYIS